MIDALSFYQPIKDFITFVVQRGDKKDKVVSEALAAIRVAVRQTKQYEERLSSGEAVNRDTEYVLADKWAEAADKARLANNELALKLNDKSRYWSDVKKWTAAQMQARGCSLSAIEDALEDLLKG